MQTAAAFGVQITLDDIQAAKNSGGANNDWVLTKDLMAGKGKNVSLEDTTAKFQELYLGSTSRPGLRETESLIPSKAVLEQLAKACPAAVVTGRPRKEAEFFLQGHGIRHLFKV